MLPQWKKNIILDIKGKMESGKKISFIHTPKCAGTYAGKFMELCQINNKFHQRANENDDITFTIIRDPVERFESFLNYRLGKGKSAGFPRKLKYCFTDQSVTLNEIINKLTQEDIISFDPYKTLVYWSHKVDLLITIDELEETLKLLGYDIDGHQFPKLNVSKKERGTINEENKEKLRNFYAEDIKLYNFWTRKD